MCSNITGKRSSRRRFVSYAIKGFGALALAAILLTIAPYVSTPTLVRFVVAGIDIYILANFTTTRNVYTLVELAVFSIIGIYFGAVLIGGVVVSLLHDGSDFTSATLIAFGDGVGAIAGAVLGALLGMYIQRIRARYDKS